MQNPQLINLKNPGSFESLDVVAADKFEEVERKNLPLLEKILLPFTQTNKQRTGYANGSRPEQETSDSYRYGSINVNVKTTPTTLKTNYKSVVEQTEEFLGFVAQDYENGRPRKGVLTIDSQAYISLDDAIHKIQELKATALDGKKGVNQEISVEAPDQITREGLDKVVFKLGNDYSAQTEENAADFARASALKKAIKQTFYNPFMAKLKEMTGYNQDNMPTETVQEYIRAGEYLFPVQIVPKENIRYAKIIDSLIKPFNKKITATTGDLIKLQHGVMNPELAAYKPRTREGSMFIRLGAMQQRIQELREEYTSRSCSYKIERSFKVS